MVVVTTVTVTSVVGEDSDVEVIGVDELEYTLTYEISK